MYLSVESLTSSLSVLMSGSPYITSIHIYPVKSLDPIAAMQATILESGAIKHDREFALFDEQGRFVNGKRHAKIHLLRSQFDDELKLLSLQVQDTDRQASFHIEREQNNLESWLSDYFGFPVKWVQNIITGFPDDLNANGPTIISTATIEAIASWFPDVSIQEMRLRLRANLEIDGVPAFWEDRLFASAGQCVRFQVGEVLLEGINPCQRCVVPTRNPQTGEATTKFQQIFIDRRRESLPSWTVAQRFNHFYKLSINTNVPVSEAGKVVRVGDTIKILGVSESNLR